MQINDVFEKYIIKKEKNEKNYNYYSKRIFWRDFFYENIKYLPHITYIGI